MIRKINLVSPHKNNYICSLASRNMQFNSLCRLVNKMLQFGYWFKIGKDSKTGNSVPFCWACWVIFTTDIVHVQQTTVGIWKIIAYNKSVYNPHSLEQLRGWNRLIFSSQCCHFDPGKWEIKQQCQPAVSSILLLHNNSAVGFANGVYELPDWDWPLGKEAFAQWASSVWGAFLHSGVPFRWLSAGVVSAGQGLLRQIVFNGCFKVHAAF